MSNSSTETDTPHNIPPYTPMTSLGQELGVLFGFLSACLVVMAVYVYFWRGMSPPYAFVPLFLIPIHIPILPSLPPLPSHS